MKTIALAGYKIAALGVLLTLIHESKIIYSKFSLSSKSCYPLPFCRCQGSDSNFEFCRLEE